MNAENPTHTSLPPTDPVLADALSGIEQGLTQIRRMSREADELRLRLDAQQAALAAREVAVADKLTTLDADKQQLETERQALRDDRAALDELTTWTEQKHAELSTREQALSTRESTIHTRESEVAELESALNSRRDELRSLAESIEARKADLETREQAFAQREKALAELEAALAAQRETITAQTTELAAQRQNLAAQATRLADVEKDLAKRELTSKDSLAKAEQIEARAKRDQNDLAQLRQNLTSAQQQASQMLKALQEATARAEAAEKVALDLRTELDQSASRDQDAQAASQERDALRAASDSLRDKLRETEEREARLTAAVKALREQSDAFAKERDELKLAIEHARESAAKTGADPAELASLKSTLAKAETDRDESSTRLASTIKELSDARLIIDDLRGQLDQHEKDTKELEGVLDQLRERLRTEAAKAEALAEQVRSAPAAPASAVPAAGANPLRTRRVELARRLARDKARKIRRVSDALGKRYEQCEQVLALRQDVLAAKRAVEAEHRKQQGIEARSRTASSLFFLACTASVLAFGSWFLAGQVAPETYTAKVVFAADSPDRQLSAGELEEWNTFHTQLVEDPRFHEFAAQRLGKQGVPGLGTPTALRERLKTSAEVTSNKPGEMVIEMKGLGRERVERELQMIAIALQSQAREAKDRRADGANTIISQAAKAGSEPIESVRMIYAGGIFGAGVLVFGVLAGIFWSRLASAKLKFDLSQSVDATADEERWNKFERKAA